MTDHSTLIAEANKWRNEDPDDPSTEVVSERVTSLIGRLTDSLEDALESVTTPTREQIAETALDLYDWEAIFNGRGEEDPRDVLYDVADAILALLSTPTNSKEQ